LLAALASLFAQFCFHKPRRRYVQHGYVSGHSLVPDARPFHSDDFAAAVLGFPGLSFPDCILYNRDGVGFADLEHALAPNQVIEFADYHSGPTMGRVCALAADR
jgi:hypothetical protein